MNSGLHGLLNKIPPQFRNVKLDEICNGAEENSFVLGKVEKISKRNKNQIRTWVEVTVAPVALHGVVDQKLFKALFLNSMSYIAQGLSVGDYLALGNFRVESMTTPNPDFYCHQLLISEDTGQVWIHSGGSTRTNTLRQIIDHPNPSPQYFDCLVVVRAWKLSDGGCKMIICDETFSKLEVNVNGPPPRDLEADCVVHLFKMEVEKRPRGRILANIQANNIRVIPSALLLSHIGLAANFTKEELLIRWYLEQNSPYTKLSKLPNEGYADVVCQVGSINVLHPGCTVIQVWDGTPPLNTSHFQPTSWLSEKVSHVLIGLVEFLMCDIWTYDEHAYAALNLKPEDFILLRNLHNRGKPFPRFTMHSGTSYNRGIQILSPTCAPVLYMKRWLEPHVGTSVADSQPLPQLGLHNIIESTESTILEKLPDPSPHPPYPSFRSSSRRPILKSQARRSEGPYRVEKTSCITPRTAQQLQKRSPRGSSAVPMQEPPLLPPSSGLQTWQLSVNPNAIGPPERSMKKSISRLRGRCNHPTVRDLNSAEPPFYAHCSLIVLEIIPQPEFPLKALWWSCSQCDYLIPYSGESSIVTCPTCPTKILELKILIFLIVSDGEEIREAHLWDTYAEEFFHGMTPADILAHPEKFSAMMSLLLHNMPILDCCLIVFQSAISHTVRLQLRNTILNEF